MRAYWELAKGGYRRYARYRTAIAAALVANTAFGLIRASLLMTTITTAGAAVGGYDLVQAFTYDWLGQGPLGAIPLWGQTELAGRVKSGEIAMDFLRPVSALGQWWGGRSRAGGVPDRAPAAGDAGGGRPDHRARLACLPACLPRRCRTSCPSSRWCWASAWRSWPGTMVNLLALWVVEIRGYHALFMIVMNLLTGLLVPVAWSPDWLRGPTPNLGARRSRNRSSISASCGPHGGAPRLQKGCGWSADPNLSLSVGSPLEHVVSRRLETKPDDESRRIHGLAR